MLRPGTFALTLLLASLTGLPALAETGVWLSICAALAFWFVAWFLGELSGGIYFRIARVEDLERAVQEAMKETGATSETETGRVIKAARSRLSGKRFDEKKLRNVVGARLRGKPQGVLCSPGS